MIDGWLAIGTLLVVVAALAAFSCWCESLRGDRYREWMNEECDRADLAEEEIARLRLTDEEREAVERAIGWILDTGSGCVMPVAATLRALLARLGGER